MKPGLALAAALYWLCVSPALADRVVLLDGAVLDGNASRAGGKVVIQMTEGTITVDAATVVRIDKAKSERDVLEERLAKVGNDVEGLVRLANYCRDHQLTSRERELLRKVIELSPDHPEARARLGFVKDGKSWLTEAQKKTRDGLVLYAGQWLTPAERMELERLAADTKAAQLARERAAVELESKRLEVEAQKAELARNEQEAARAAAREQQGWGYGYGYGVPLAYGFRPSGRVNTGVRNGPYPGTTGYQGAPPPFISGAPDPRNMSWSTPGVRDPRSYFGR